MILLFFVVMLYRVKAVVIDCMPTTLFGADSKNNSGNELINVLVQNVSLIYMAIFIHTFVWGAELISIHGSFKI
jgi:hypothetical protein